MKTLKVYGASDDLIETSGIEGCDEFNKVSDTPYVGYLAVDDGKTPVRIHCIYDGSWAFAITSNDEDNDYRSFPDWTIRSTWGKDCPYSETLEIDVPDDTVLVGFVEAK